jgi:DNA-binding NarL/FixJ family response regulator
METVGGVDPRSNSWNGGRRSHRRSRTFPERERRVLYLRFFAGMTQSEIADDIGVSQMHVSRILSNTLELLRATAVSGSSDAPLLEDARPAGPDQAADDDEDDPHEDASAE